jgi:hypothetical protein
MAKYPVIVLAVLLVGCAGTKQPPSGTQNPSEHCRSLGLEEGTEDFQNCVGGKIQDTCLSRGLQAGSPEYADCESNLRDATFLRQQLQMRGF